MCSLHSSIDHELSYVDAHDIQKMSDDKNDKRDVLQAIGKSVRDGTLHEEANELKRRYVAEAKCKLAAVCEGFEGVRIDTEFLGRLVFVVGMVNH